MLPGIIQGLEKKKGIKTEMLDPFRSLDIAALDAVLLKSIAPQMAVAVGLALRQPGDKIMLEAPV